MEFNIPSYFIWWLVRVFTFIIIILTLFATINIFQSIYFRFWSSRDMGDTEKREFYVKNMYDVKWSLSLMIMAILGFFDFLLMGPREVAWWNLLVAFLFSLLAWGNYRTLVIERKRLNR